MGRLPLLPQRPISFRSGSSAVVICPNHHVMSFSCCGIFIMLYPHSMSFWLAGALSLHYVFLMRNVVFWIRLKLGWLLNNILTFLVYSYRCLEMTCLAVYIVGIALMVAGPLSFKSFCVENLLVFYRYCKPDSHQTLTWTTNAWLTQN